MGVQAEATRTTVPEWRHGRLWSLALLLGMVVHAYLKWRWGTLPELLWGCNVASFAIILGLWLGRPELVGMAFVWHLGVGEPGWFYGVVQTGHTHWVSVLMHTLPAVAALFYLKRTGLPRSAPWLAFLMFVALVPISHYLTPPNLNVNLAHQRVYLLQRKFPGNWDYRLVFSAIMLAILLGWDWVAGRLLGRPARLAQ